LENSKFQIYTGCGKGKTTAAIGLGIRAIGRNKKVYFIQLLKYQESGEEKILKNLKNFTFKKFGFKEFIINNNIKPEHRIQINKAIKYIDYILNKKKFDLNN
jgi:cob(I)alamin adenosyltransferase